MSDFWTAVGPYFNLQGLCAILNSLWLLVLSFFVQLGLMPNKLTVQPTVFVSENEYQIVWESRYPSSGWVTVGDEKYVDSVGGQLIFDQKIHKVSVPLEALDAAKGYEIHWQHVLKGPLIQKQGKVMTKAYAFRPIDFSDGLQIYHIADTHSLMNRAGQAGKYWGDKLDLLILNGDIITDIEMPRLLSDAMRLAWDITRGERPVLYARGNHETRGASSNDLSRYVGAPSADRWYYTTRLGPLWIAVYEAGEDKEDGHEEYAGLADFEQYREKETAFFDNVITKAETEFDAPGVEYRLLVSHIPVGSGSRWYPEVMATWQAQANRMKLDLALHGHWHRVQYFAPGEFKNYEEAANYPVIIGCKPSHDADSNGIFTGTAVEFRPEAIRGWFTDQRHETVSELPEIVRG